MEKCTFCQTPGKERPLDMPRACEEVCPTGAIKSGPMAELAKVNREQLEEIAKMKDPDLTAADMDAAVRTIAGSARSMGIDVEGGV